jgi:hypothetical protein
MMLPWAIGLLAACGSETPDRGGLRARAVDANLEGAVGGLESELKVEHFAGTSFGQITTVFGDDFADAVVEGKSFDGFSEVYVLSLDLHNSTDRALPVPDLLIRPSEAMDGEPDVTFRARNRTVAPQSRAQVLYFWDPARTISSLNARLAPTQ